MEKACPREQDVIMVYNTFNNRGAGQLDGGGRARKSRGFQPSAGTNPEAKRARKARKPTNLVDGVCGGGEKKRGRDLQETPFTNLESWSKDALATPVSLSATVKGEGVSPAGKDTSMLRTSCMKREEEESGKH